MATGSAQVQILEPSDHLLIFRGRFSTDAVASTIKLCNPTQHNLLFKVRKPSYMDYVIRPGRGLLHPQEEVTIQVLVPPFTSVPSEKKDRFTLQSIVAPPDFTVERYDRVWKEVSQCQIQSIKLQGVFRYDPASTPADSSWTSVTSDEHFNMQVRKPQELILNPPKELIFKEPFEEEVKLALHNPTSKPVVYRVYGTVLSQYTVTPPSGVVQPQQSAHVTVTLKPRATDDASLKSMNAYHKIVIRAVSVSPDFKDSVEKLLKETLPREIMRSELQCVFLKEKPAGDSKLSLQDPVEATNSLRDEKALSISESSFAFERRKKKEACERVIREKSTVKMRAVRFNHLGLPRSGKSSFRRRLTGEMSNIFEARKKGEREQPSTGVAEDGGQVLIRSVSGDMASKIWSTLRNTRDETNMLRQLCYQIASMSTFTQESSASSKLPADSSEVLSSEESQPEPLMSVSSILSDMEDLIEKTFDIMEAEDWEEIKDLLEDTTWLINTDTGGHAEFLDLQASLVQGPSFNLLYSRLEDELESQFKVYYTNEEGESTEDEYSTMTVEEVIFQTLSTIACFGCSFFTEDTASESGKLHNSLPGYSKSKVMFVGTFRDKVCKEEFERKDRLLQQKVKSTEFYDKGIIRFASKDHLMLEVNNMTGKQDEIDQIRKIFEKVIEESFEQISIPASWLVLSLCLRKKKKHTVSLEECKKLAGKLKINPDELLHALWFLHHCVGVLLYYPEVEALKDTVICHMQVVYDSTSNLIKNTFTFEKVGHKASEEFREKAKFSLTDIRKAMSHYEDDLIPPEKLVKLLEFLSILTTMPAGNTSTTKPTYFMPCILKCARASKLKILSSNSSDPAPLMIRYDCGYVPVGLFPSIITSLISQQLDGWKMIEEVYKNRVQFFVGRDFDTVTLISHPQYLEVVISRSPKFETSTESLCTYVRHIVQSTLNTVTLRMNHKFSMGYKFGFECPQHPERQHLCMLAHDASDEQANLSARRMLCLHNPKKEEPVLLESKHKIWFSESIIPVKEKREDSVPVLGELLCFHISPDETVNLAEMIENCSTLGVLLLQDKTGQIIAGIEKELKNNAADINRRVFQKWLSGEGKQPVSWATLVTVLQEMRLNNLAKKIELKYNNYSV